MLELEPCRVPKLTLIERKTLISTTVNRTMHVLAISEAQARELLAQAQEGGLMELHVYETEVSLYVDGDHFLTVPRFQLRASAFPTVQ